MKTIVGNTVLSLLSLSEAAKDGFYDQLRSLMAEISDKEFLVPCGDWNGHIGREALKYEEVETLGRGTQKKR